MIGIRKAAFKPWPLALVLVAALAACGEEGRRDWGRAAPAAQPARDPEAAYLAPPRVVTAAVQGGGVALSGSAAAGAMVRLGSPTGEATSVEADASGLWRIVLPGSAEPKLFSLSMTREGRVVQAEGYVLVSPEGGVALLKAGGGAEPLSGPSDSLRILAIDYDQEGGAVISGVGRPGAGFGIRVDRVTQAEGKVDAQGRFSFSLTRPLGHGEHAVQVGGEGGEDLVRIAVSSPGPMTSGPLRSERLDGAWRADWMTPGGGVQTTVIYSPGAAR